MRAFSNGRYARLLAEDRIAAVVAVLAPGDAHWPTLAVKLAADGQRLQTASGGATRQESVLNGLEHLKSQAADDDWVLVHDAARPC